ncbi:hypothetical protein V8E55_007898 [Tylopilus felleus]
MAPKSTSRDELTSRTIPRMVLSERSDPLTRPLSPSPPNLTPAARAAWRSAVQGNAIVTGGCGNFGMIAAQALLEHGASGISLWDVQPENAGPATVSELGSVDTLLCFAGVVACTHALELSLDEWKRSPDGETTNDSVNFPQPQMPYNVSKGALLQLKNSLAAEWARYGICVNSINLGYVDTILNHKPCLEETRRIWTSRNPMGRIGHPAELTGVVVLLCRAGRYINGADITIDGGGSVF